MDAKVGVGTLIAAALALGEGVDAGMFDGTGGRRGQKVPPRGTTERRAAKKAAKKAKRRNRR